MLSAANAGSASVRLAETRLLSADGSALGEQPDLAYVLPGQTRTWPLPTAAAGATANAAPGLRVRALSQLGAIDDVVALDPN